MKKIVLAAMMMIVGLTTGYSQEQEIDPSKPTNLYSGAGIELGAVGKDKVARLSAMFSWNPKNLLLSELPFKVSPEGKMQAGNLRLRYFNVPYLDYSKTFGAFGLSVDAFIPVGNADGGRITVAPGAVLGLIASEKFSMFPIASYLYTSKSRFQKIEGDHEMHGAQFELMMVYSSGNFYARTSPKYKLYDFKSGTESCSVDLMFGWTVGKHWIGAYAKKEFGKGKICPQNELSLIYTFYF
ncbi:hypothetical protein [Persicobacter diffluens]|uniref:Uncharacterized protein n=1 Tax=Persicobacter diffluens TaxID=981 RepID=A0AAN4W4Q5_9BACT|nr:hypothetical protein PEDI_56590 [Persicobacter diffluens]